MKVRLVFRLTLGAILLTPFVLGRTSQAQTARYIICKSKQAWLVSESVAISAGQCGNKDWAFTIEVEPGLEKKQKLDDDERQAFAILRKTPKRNPVLLSLDEAKLSPIIDDRQSLRTVTISADFIPAYAREFFSKAEILKDGMYFIISSGNWFIDTDQYKEAYRWTIIVPGNNPTIGDILEEVKRELGNNPLLGKEHLYLIVPHKSDPLDNKKTVAEYALKNGSVLWLGSHLR
jgi:hypothetical protein